MKIKLCDQYGILFKDSDIPDSKDYKKLFKREDGFCTVDFGDKPLEIIQNDEFVTVHHFIKDNQNNIKVHEIFNGIIL